MSGNTIRDSVFFYRKLLHTLFLEFSSICETVNSDSATVRLIINGLCQSLGSDIRAGKPIVYIDPLMTCIIISHLTFPFYPTCHVLLLLILPSFHFFAPVGIHITTFLHNFYRRFSWSSLRLTDPKNSIFVHLTIILSVQ